MSAAIQVHDSDHLECLHFSSMQMLIDLVRRQQTSDSTTELSSFQTRNHHVDLWHLAAEEPSKLECQHLENKKYSYKPMAM